MLQVYRVWIVSLLLVSALNACGVPRNMQVHTGVEPENQDDDVRFRTTYYLRVLDRCTDGKEIVQDSLYRFRMTGKAGSLANNVHFESGILHKDKIDPFGTARALKEKKPVYTSAPQPKVQQGGDDQPNAAQTLPDAKRDSFAKYLQTDWSKAYADLEAKKNEIAERNKQLKSRLNGQSCERIDRSEEEQTKKKKCRQIKANEKLIADIQVRLDSSVKHITERFAQDAEGGIKSLCANGKSPQRGYEIFGPQGKRVFDVDQRLLLAMSSSAAPLIGTLKNISARMQNQASEKDDLRQLMLVRGLLYALQQKLKKQDGTPKTSLTEDELDNDFVQPVKGVKQ